jgi:hypothetical protein
MYGNGGLWRSLKITEGAIGKHVKACALSIISSAHRCFPPVIIALRASVNIAGTCFAQSLYTNPTASNALMRFDQQV